MKGTFDKIYLRLSESYEAAKAMGGLGAILSRPPVKSEIIGNLAGAIPTQAFGKKYFEAMVIVFQAHWLVSLVLDLKISGFFMPDKETPNRTALVFELLAHTPMPSKIEFVKKHQLLDKKNVDRLVLINTARNGFAHFYHPESQRMKYRKSELVSENGLEKFWKDCEEVLHDCHMRSKNGAANTGLS